MCNTCGCSAAEEINPVESVVVPAPLGRGVAQFYSEGGDMANYTPSREPDMESPAMEPTNATFNAESKSMFGKDKNGKMYARRRNGEIITHNAETRPLSEDEELLAIYNDGGEHKGFIEMEDDLEDESIEIEISDDEMNEIADVTLDAEHEGLYACSKCKHWNRNPVDDITKCKKCGNDTFTFVKRSEFMPAGDGNVVGQQTFGFNGTPLHAESFNAEAIGNEIGCDKCGRFAKLWSYANFDLDLCATCSKKEGFMAEYEADYALEKPFTTGVKLSAGLLTGAALFGVVGASLTALLGSVMSRGE